MSILKEIAGAVAAVFALMLMCDGLFGVNETRFDDDYFQSNTYEPRSNAIDFASHRTPAARVSDAFAQFTPGDAKPNKRRPSAA